MQNQVIVISNIETNEVKLRVPQCSIRKDGTVWHQDRTPIIIAAHAPNREALGVKYKAALEAKRFGDIAPEHFARLGVVGIMHVEWEPDYDKRMGAIRNTPEARAKREQEEREKREREARQITVYLSSRGWGDYSPVEWQGDRETPTAEIVAQCQRLLAEGYDVDRPTQTDEQITLLVEEAKRESIQKQQASAARETELTATEIPANAIAAYKACGGDPENFEDDIDDPRYWLVRKYADAIEQQGKAGSTTLRKFSAELHAAACAEPHDE